MTQYEKVYQYLTDNYKENEPIFLSNISIPGIKAVSVRQQMKKSPLKTEAHITKEISGLYSAMRTPSDLEIRMKPGS